MAEHENRMTIDAYRDALKNFGGRKLECLRDDLTYTVYEIWGISCMESKVLLKISPEGGEVYRFERLLDKQASIGNGIGRCLDPK